MQGEQCQSPDHGEGREEASSLTRKTCSLLGVAVPTGSPDQGGEPAGDFSRGPRWSLLILNGSLARRFEKKKKVYKLGKMRMFNEESEEEMRLVALS